MQTLKNRVSLDMLVWGAKYPHIKQKEFLQIIRVHGENYQESDIPAYLRKVKVNKRTKKQ